MKKIKSAIISVYYKDGLEELVNFLHTQEVEIYSTGGTAQYLESLKIPCVKIEDVTSFPEILGGRVKTLHPAVFGGLLARRDVESDLKEMSQNKLPFYDLMICNLYPFEEYLKNNASEEELIEKIDIGGVSLIRAAAKNFKETVCISNPNDYSVLLELLKKNQGNTTIEERKLFASHSFRIIANYDMQIANYFEHKQENTLRYGENPHQAGKFVGDFDAMFTKHNGKEISYNNILDIDAGIKIISEFSEEPTFAIIKHNNTCGLATRNTILEAYKAAFECDTKSAFGGVLISNKEIDETTATEMNTLFFEILIAPSYSEKALEILKSKKNRVLLTQKLAYNNYLKKRTALNGMLVQDEDRSIEGAETWKIATENAPNTNQFEDLVFGIKAVKHLKSNAIAIVKNKQLIGMGCGQTSRIDALEQSINKAKLAGFDLQGAIMTSDAFFPFADSVEIAHLAGITAIAQPGGSIKDQDSIDYCNKHQIAMVMTGVRHFNH